MKKFKKIAIKLSTMVPALALLIGFVTAKRPCIVYYHQPKVPTAFDKYR